jgi:hypothetical protein
MTVRFDNHWANGLGGIGKVDSNTSRMPHLTRCTCGFLVARLHIAEEKTLSVSTNKRQEQFEGKTFRQVLSQ